MKLDKKTKEALFEFLLMLGDNRLILGHRLSEWCGHAPIIEEDIALGNIALDLIGQSSAFLNFAAVVEDKGKTEDDLAYFRNETEFKNLQLVEQPNIDFAYTIVRQYFFDVYSNLTLESLTSSPIKELAGISSKSLKENKYHLRHSKQWLLRLGDGTDTSNLKTQNAVDNLWRFTKEIFEHNETENILIDKGKIPETVNLSEQWYDLINKTFEEAKIKIPENNSDFSSGSRNGFHSEYLGHLLAEMQILARSYPGAKW